MSNFSDVPTSVADTIRGVTLQRMLLSGPRSTTVDRLEQYNRTNLLRYHCHVFHRTGLQGPSITGLKSFLDLAIFVSVVTRPILCMEEP